MNNALSVVNFSFTLFGISILKDIRFDLEKGGYLAVVGPNGAGKSSLLKCLMRLHEGGDTQGNIFIRNVPQSRLTQRELARTIAYVPQAGGRIPPFTVREFLKLARYPYAYRRGASHNADREALDKALDLTHTTHLAMRRLNALSGGERQKAYLAAALAQETDVLLLDEPTSFLDPKHAAEVDCLLHSLNRERGLTIVTVTHDLNHPLDAGGMVLVLREGEQVFFGAARSLTKEGVLESAFGHTFTYTTHPGTGKPLVLADRFQVAS